jgi:cell division protein FtsZ
MREMGKAMMGTGEATGEKRALTAAEAAINNPLIDDASMKGARGLLISITGGKDLTLYEVDEAATRIREEVDVDANIIVGATFDETLDGTIRVSVVATGIDKIGLVNQPLPAENALKELAGKMRQETKRMVERPALKPQSGMNAGVAAVEQAAHAAVAAALAPAPTAMSAPSTIEDVSIRPMPIKPSLFEPAPMEAPHAEADMPEAFIPPAPEMVKRAPRMPRIDELPMPAQNQMAPRPEMSDDHPQKQRMSLMQRLASVGLGKREEAEQAPPRMARPMPQFEQPQARPTARNPEGRYPDSRPVDPVSEYARRAQPQGLDPHGRTAPVHNPGTEDQLDIPAFLRRQAN